MLQSDNGKQSSALQSLSVFSCLKDEVSGEARCY